MKSDIYKINNSEEGVKVSVSAETMELLLLAKEIYENSDGAFNIAIYPLTKLWKFDSANFNYSVKEAPNDEKIEELLQYCSFTKDNFILDKENLTVTKKHKECALDLGAMVKGYNLDIARKVAEKYGISNSLYSFGGSSILGYGKSYNLGLIDANNKERILGALLLPQNYCISTSGVYERFYKDSAGNSYHHILDKSGKPANSKVVGVTVVGKSGVVCDMISTAVVVLGAEKGRELMQKYDLYGIIILEGNKFTTVGRVGFSLELTDYERV